MAVFTARNASSSTVPAPSREIWKLITDPETLADLTPLVRSIEAAGPRWEWTLEGIAALGLNVDAVFTERMDFTEGSKIVFTHDPPAEKHERTGLSGVYDLTPVSDEATVLAVDLSLTIDMPLPGMSRKAVEGLLESMMRATGAMFASNLYERLGLDPSTVEITESTV
ncbi:MAG: SRPBCC family protein [Acidimicrobiales bacterium]